MPTNRGILTKQDGMIARCFALLFFFLSMSSLFADSPCRTHLTKVVALDLGGVVVRNDATAMARALGLSQDLSVVIKWPEFLGLEDGSKTVDEFQAAFERHFRISVSKKVFRQAFASVGIEIFDGVAAALIEVTKHRPLYAVSNTNAVHYAYLRKKFGALRAFNRIFASFHARVQKPDRRFYDWAFQRMRQENPYLSLQAGEVLFVDDRPENIDAATAFGFRSEQVTAERNLLAILRDDGLIP